MPNVFELVPRPNPRQHQDMRRFQGAGAQHNPVGFEVEYLAAALNFQTRYSCPLKERPAREHVAFDGQVEPMTHRAQVGDGSAHADTTPVIHRDCADAGGIGAVQVGVVGVTPFNGGGVECFLHVGPRLVSPPHYGDGAVAAVEIVVDVQVGLGFPEEGQDLQISPLLVAEGGPAFEVFRQPAQINLPVDGTRPADDLALRDVDFPLLVVDDTAQRP